MKNSIPWIIIAVLILLIIGERSCNNIPPDPALPIVITHSDTIKGDSIPVQVFVPKPYPVRVDCLKWQFYKVDTLAILQAYYSRRIYSDTLKNDTSALVVVNDTVMFNSLQNRSLIFQNRRPTLISYTTTIQPTSDARRLKLFVGPSVGRSLETFAIGASAMLITKNDAAYALTYDIFNKEAYVSIFWKITLRRNKDPSQ